MLVLGKEFGSIVSGANLALHSQSPSNWTRTLCRLLEMCKNIVFQSKGVDQAVSRQSLQILPMKRGVTASTG